MKTKEQRFHTIMDIYAFRVVVDTQTLVIAHLARLTACTSHARAA
ncbi:hypothetical protein O9993_04335 [Vibrio lentus]|nr:hypothetical protein [Vibrio lentus]